MQCQHHLLSSAPFVVCARFAINHPGHPLKFSQFSTFHWHSFLSFKMVTVDSIIGMIITIVRVYKMKGLIRTLWKCLFVNGNKLCSVQIDTSLHRNNTFIHIFQGKYIEVSFDFKGDTTGGAISNCKYIFMFLVAKQSSKTYSMHFFQKHIRSNTFSFSFHRVPMLC